MLDLLSVDISLFLTLYLTGMNIVSFLRANMVPGISIEQENIVSKDKEDKGRLPLTVTS